MRRVYVCQDGYRNFGEVRYEVEWITVRPSAFGKDEIDPDSDTITNVEYYKWERDALQRAKRLVKTPNIPLCWGVATVTQQVVGWLVEEDGIAEWVNVGDSQEIS